MEDTERASVNRRRALKGADTRMFKARWTMACDAVKKRGLIVHDTKDGAMRDAERSALASLMADLRALFEKL